MQIPVKYYRVQFFALVNTTRLPANCGRARALRRFYGIQSFARVFPATEEARSFLGRSCDFQLDFDAAEAWIPTLEMSWQVAIDDLGAGLKRQMSTLARPPHLVLTPSYYSLHGG
jgi:hypothetical protein